MKKIMQRITEPTPHFFRKIRNAGLLLTAISGAVITAPIALPATLITAAGYLALAGAIASAISQTAVNNEAQP